MFDHINNFLRCVRKKKPTYIYNYVCIIIFVKENDVSACNLFHDGLKKLFGGNIFIYL